MQCISVSALYNEYGENLEYCRIEHTLEGGKDYYDLHSGNHLVCMDGEQCRIILQNEDIVELSNADGEAEKTFRLTAQEFAVATFK